MGKNLQLPQDIQQAAQDGRTGRVASYIQDTCTAWKPTDCYEAATRIVDNTQGKKQ